MPGKYAASFSIPVAVCLLVSVKERCRVGRGDVKLKIHVSHDGMKHLV